MIKNFTFQVPVRVIFGNGSLNTLEQECSVLGTDKIMLVTDEGIVNTPAFSMVIDNLSQANIKPVVFSGVVPDPDAECLEKGLNLLHQSKCQALIALGGGSSIDTTKGISILATNPPPIQQYEGIGKYSLPVLPFIAIPTTAGTGSEMTQAAIFTSHDENRKYNVSGNLAILAILDPAVLTELPRSVAASAGMDAISHAVESYISVRSSPVSEMFSITSLKLAVRHIRDFVTDRHNSEAGTNMLLASMLGGIAASNAGLGVVHAMADVLGGQFHTAHGVNCAVMLPSCLEPMANICASKFAFMARILEPDIYCATDSDCARALPELFARLTSDIGIEPSLSKLGIKENDIELLDKAAIKAGLRACPVDFSIDDIEKILRQSL